MKLTKEELDDELSYLISVEILKKTMDKGLLKQEEFEIAKEELLKLYQPLISSLIGD